MPYSIVNDHPDCSGYAVIKDEGRQLMGCHRSMAQAERQLTALNIAEYGNQALPDNYRPASSEDVPDGRNCGNCVHFIQGYCNLWQENVQASFYCNRWVMREDTVTERAPAPPEDQIQGGDAGKAWADAIVEREESRVSQVKNILAILRHLV